MGCHANITATTFPPQGSMLNQRVRVCFHYDTSVQLDGVVARDDTAEPYVTIIRLEDGRLVLSSECQYSLPVRERKVGG